MQIEIESGNEKIRAEWILSEGPPRAGMIVVHDGGGYGEHAIGVAQELSDAGFAALAINMYTRAAPAPGISNPELLAFLRSVSDAQILRDLQAGIDYLRAELDDLARKESGDSKGKAAPKKIAMLGYCWGGACTFLASAHTQGLSAAISWYGELRTEELNSLHPEHPFDALLARTCPVLALFAELDPYVPVAYVEELKKRVDENPIELDIVVYPGLGHGFAHRGREHFDAAGHDDGWDRIRKFLDRVL